MSSVLFREVIDPRLCTNCGTCVGVCPESAITMNIDASKGVYIPTLTGKCNGCGTCIKVCPGLVVDFKELNLVLFNKSPNDYLLGNYVHCYVGYATDYRVRYNSSSGGLVTSLLLFALDYGMIDGALVTKMDDKHPLISLPYLARSRQDIISAAGSKYCPNPINAGLKHIIKHQGRFAVVGLPCHIHGIRKAQLILEDLKDKIAFCFGLACHSTPSFKATEYILKNLGINRQDVVSIAYRGKGWPGGMTIKLRNGTELFVPFKSTIYWGRAFTLFFKPFRCSLCEDKTNELADVSFMDAWLPEFLEKDKIGTSLIISRSKHGDELIRKAKKEGYIEVSTIHCDAIIRSQALEYAKRSFAARYLIMKALGKRVPLYNKSILPPKLHNFRDAFLFYLRNNPYISKNYRIITALIKLARHRR